MGKLLAVIGAIVVLPALGLATVVAALTGGSSAPSNQSTATGVTASPGSTPAVPADWRSIEMAAAATCPGLSWSVLAGIGTVESDSGRSTAPGVHSGANSAGAEGPMQFEPATFAAHATVGPGGASPASPYDVVDAVYTAAALLCSDGGGTANGLHGAIFEYNHDDAYVDTVLILSLAFGADPTADQTVATALTFTARQLGTPYRWGGTGAGGFDCSGLVQAAYAAADVHLPRVAQDQFDAGPQVSSGSTVQPGDLLFFGTGSAVVDHVGIYVGSGLMVDAPHTGAVVRVEPAKLDDFVGASRPG